MGRFRPALVVLAIVALAVACGNDAAPTPPGTPSTPTPPGPSVQPLRILLLTATTGFRHDDAIRAARQVLPQLGSQTGEFTITATEDLADFTADRLAATDILFFANTTGELPFSDAQKTAIVRFVENGGGFIGTHSATDTLYDWADYGRIVGAYFNGHPWTQEATVTVEGGSHPATRDLGASFRIHEEFYTFRDNPRSRVTVLLSLNAASVGATGDYPLAWSQSIGQGRAFYTALGHFESTWRDLRFQAHLRGAIRWVGKRD
jgi:type 1 glutamine amidotransferase